ncbi:MAG: Rieske (2Fe-2S) protein [Hahellaceae bacterium]|nr:Rieske (2Fe-2S) protein [Hahellaceae bacterium]MCP5168502.1 Rieske (2Fe-2S) protein [Hahellaceae bacterium]
MHFLCRLEAIGLQQSKGFNIEGTVLFVVRTAHGVFAYKNQCPHRGIELEWFPDRFLNHDQEYIICSTHGALFDIRTGRCVSGPCVDEHLISIPAEIRGDDVFVALS